MSSGITRNVSIVENLLGRQACLVHNYLKYIIRDKKLEKNLMGICHSYLSITPSDKIRDRMRTGHAIDACAAETGAVLEIKEELDTDNKLDQCWSRA